MAPTPSDRLAAWVLTGAIISGCTGAAVQSESAASASKRT